MAELEYELDSDPWETGYQCFQNRVITNFLEMFGLVEHKSDRFFLDLEVMIQPTALFHQVFRIMKPRLPPWSLYFFSRCFVILIKFSQNAPDHRIDFIEIVNGFIFSPGSLHKTLNRNIIKDINLLTFYYFWCLSQCLSQAPPHFTFLLTSLFGMAASMEDFTIKSGKRFRSFS
jgi:hypothetical protein